MNEDAIKAERERCARVCERIGSAQDGTIVQWLDTTYAERKRTVIRTADQCARAIRALSDEGK